MISKRMVGGASEKPLPECHKWWCHRDSVVKVLFCILWRPSWDWEQKLVAALERQEYSDIHTVLPAPLSIDTPIWCWREIACYYRFFTQALEARRRGKVLRSNRKTAIDLIGLDYIAWNFLGFFKLAKHGRRRWALELFWDVKVVAF